jgi:hypothetical protein|eukprot:SAG25_NODE_344_length_9418_cov_328.220815_2_plen_98_part_00
MARDAEPRTLGQGKKRKRGKKSTHKRKKQRGALETGHEEAAAVTTLSSESLLLPLHPPCHWLSGVHRCVRALFCTPIAVAEVWGGEGLARHLCNRCA